MPGMVVAGTVVIVVLVVMNNRRVDVVFKLTTGIVTVVVVGVLHAHFPK